MGTTNSDLITNIVASPTVLNDVGVDGGRLRIKAGTVSLSSGVFDDNDIIRLARFDVKNRIMAILMDTDAIDGGDTLDMNCGLYKTDGTVVDVDAYAKDVKGWHAAKSLFSENYAFEARALNAIEQRIWEDAGLDSVPSYGEMDVCWTVNTGVGSFQSSSTMHFMILYTED